MKKQQLLITCIVLTAMFHCICYAQKITRKELKCISPPGYWPQAGLKFTEQVADDCAALGVDMIRIEMIGERNEDRAILYEAYDKIAERAGLRGMKVLGILDYETVSHGGADDWATPEFRKRFVARIAEIVTHYSAFEYPIRHWEIWNEEDLCVEEFCPYIEVRAYALLLIDSYNAIKKIDPDATVVLGGISPKGFEYEKNYLEELYKTPEIKQFRDHKGYYPFDVVACHPYPEVFKDPIRASGGLMDVLDKEIKSVMNAHGDGDKKVWLTEMGWSSSQVSEKRQAQYLTDSYLLCDIITDPANPDNPPYVERYFWFCYRDWGKRDWWGLYTEDLSRKKPSYFAFKELGPEQKESVTPTPSPTPPFLIYTESVGNVENLSIKPDAGDPMNGKKATTISGGFHPLAENPEDRGTCFTDGKGLGDFTGLLRDYPGENTPAWGGFWNLDGGKPVVLNEIRVFSGNKARDGRVFQHYDVYVTRDPNPKASSEWTLFVEGVVCDQFMASNINQTKEAYVSLIKDYEAGAMAKQITGLRLDFYAVSITDKVFHDKWDTGKSQDKDLAKAAIESPMIFEVDAYFGRESSEGIPAAPENLVVKPGQGFISLSWKEILEPGCAGYNIYRSIRKAGPYFQLNRKPIDTPCYNDRSIIAEGTYYYVVTSVDKALNESSYSIEASVDLKKETGLEDSGADIPLAFPPEIQDH